MAHKQWITQRVPIPPGLQCVLFIPEEEMPTKEARGALPNSLSYEDAIFNITRASMMVNCFATGQFAPMRYAMQDRLHQQYRAHMYPFDDFIKAALDAGAHGACLSGAGPCILAIAGGHGGPHPGEDTMSQLLSEAVSDAMLATARQLGRPGTVRAASSPRPPASTNTPACTTIYDNLAIPTGPGFAWPWGRCGFQVHIATPSLTGFKSSGTAEDGAVLWDDFNPNPGFF